MTHPKYIRFSLRKPSVADVGGGRLPMSVRLCPYTASGCQAFRRYRSSSPGDCSSKGRFSLRSFSAHRSGVPLHDTATVARAAAPAPSGPRTEVTGDRSPRDAERSCPRAMRTNCPGITIVHSAPAALSGMRSRDYVARFGAFCFCSPRFYDAMDFVCPAPRQIGTSRRCHPFGWTAITSGESALAQFDTAVPSDTRSSSKGRSADGSRFGSSCRNTTSVRGDRHTTSVRVSARHRMNNDICLPCFHRMDAPGRHPDCGPVLTSCSERISSRRPHVYRPFATTDRTTSTRTSRRNSDE